MSNHEEVLYSTLTAANTFFLTIDILQKILKLKKVVECHSLKYVLLSRIKVYFGWKSANDISCANF